MSYSDAKATCIGRADHAELGSLLKSNFFSKILASILEKPEQAYAYALSKGADTWIGLEWNDGEGEYQWSDNWPVWYTHWGENFPNNDLNDKCVNLRENKNQQEAEWVQSSCSAKKVSIF